MDGPALSVGRLCSHASRRSRLPRQVAARHSQAQGTSALIRTNSHERPDVTGVERVTPTSENFGRIVEIHRVARPSETIRADRVSGRTPIPADRVGGRVTACADRRSGRTIRAGLAGRVTSRGQPACVVSDRLRDRLGRWRGPMAAHRAREAGRAVPAERTRKDARLSRRQSPVGPGRRAHPQSIRCVVHVATSPSESVRRNKQSGHEVAGTARPPYDTQHPARELTQAPH